MNFNDYWFWIEKRFSGYWGLGGFATSMEDRYRIEDELVERGKSKCDDWRIVFVPVSVPRDERFAFADMLCDCLNNGMFIDDAYEFARGLIHY